MLKLRKFTGRLVFLLILIIVLLIFTSIIVLSIYPLSYTEYINKYSKEYNIDPFLISAIINVESKYNKRAISHKQAKGLMQIGPGTGEWASEELEIKDYNIDTLYDPETNIQIGTWYLDRLKNEFNNDINLVLAAYNGGSGNVQKWIKDKRYSHNGKDLHKIPFKETENYVKNVKSNYKIYKIIYKDYINNANSYSRKYIDFINNIKEYIKELSLNNS